MLCSTPASRGWIHVGSGAADRFSASNHGCRPRHIEVGHGVLQSEAGSSRIVLRWADLGERVE
jgi:hypothetical protein